MRPCSTVSSGAALTAPCEASFSSTFRQAPGCKIHPVWEMAMPLRETSAVGASAFPVTSVRATPSVEPRSFRSSGRDGSQNPQAETAARPQKAEAPAVFAEQADFFIVSEQAADRYLARAKAAESVL